MKKSTKPSGLLGKFKTLEEILVQRIEKSEPDPGMVYGIRNEHMPDLVKIGLTRVGVKQRIHTLGTACPRPYLSRSSTL